VYAALVLFALAGAATLVGRRPGTDIPPEVHLGLALLTVASTGVILVTRVGSIFAGVVAVLASLGLVAGALGQRPSGSSGAALTAWATRPLEVRRRRRAR
jgi:hypothetical protein